MIRSNGHSLSCDRLGRMVEAGLVDKWHRDEVTNFKMKQTASQGKEESQGAGTNEGQVRVAIKPLALDHLQVRYTYLSGSLHSELALPSLLCLSLMVHDTSLFFVRQLSYTM